MEAYDHMGLPALNSSLQEILLNIVPNLAQLCSSMVQECLNIDIQKQKRNLDGIWDHLDNVLISAILLNDTQCIIILICCNPLGV